MSIGIITDSTCDLPLEVLQRHNVISIPLQVAVNDKTMRDWLDIEPVALYQWMLLDGIIPKTSPPSINDLLMCYETALERHDSVIAIHMSGRLSETYARAQQAVRVLGAEDRVALIDSQYVNSAVAAMVMELIRRTEHGEDNMDVLVKEILRIRDTTISLYVPHSLKWLVAGGWLSPAQNIVGNILNVRPFISIVDGVVTNDGTTRKNQMINGLIKRLIETFGSRPIRLAFSSAGTLPTALEEFQAQLNRSGLNVVSARSQIIGPVIGAHLGPSTIGVSAYPLDDEIIL